MLLWAATCATVRGEGTPKIEFDRTSHDFGVTSLVESVTGTFTFHNKGDADLQIGKPTSNCGCTVAKLSPQTLKPGEKGELVFTMTLGAGDQVLAKSIFVPSNDPQNPTVRLDVQVETKQVLEAIPQMTALDELRVGTSTNATVVVKRNDGRKLTITRLEPSSSLLTARVEPQEGNDSQEARILIQAKAEGLPRQFSEMVSVYTDDSAGRAIIFFVSGRMTGDIQLDPPELVWGLPDPDNPSTREIDIIRTRSITITSTQAERPLEIRNIKCSLKELRVKLETVEKGKEYDLEVTMRRRPKEPLNGTISFETNLPNLPKVEVPVTINIWKASGS